MLAQALHKQLLGGAFEARVSLLAPLPARRNGVSLNRRRGAVEHEHRAHAVSKQASDAAVEAKQVRVLDNFAGAFVTHRLRRAT